MNDQEHHRKRRTILEFVFKEAADGRLYTSSSLSKILAGKFGLGSQHTIRKLISECETKGFIRFIGCDAAADYGQTRPKSPIGYVCVEGMGRSEWFDPETGKIQPEVEFLPTHYRDARSEQVFELRKEDVRKWEYDMTETELDSAKLSEQ